VEEFSGIEIVHRRPDVSNSSRRTTLRARTEIMSVYVAVVCQFPGDLGEVTTMDCLISLPFSCVLVDDVCDWCESSYCFEKLLIALIKKSDSVGVMLEA